MLVGYPPGGATDVIARLIAQHLGESHVETAIVENRPGASGRIALEAARRADRDGSTVIVTPDFPLTIFPSLYRKIAYDPVQDFVPVSMVGRSEFALCVGPGVPSHIATVAKFVQWCRANPSHALYGSPAPGSTGHFVGTMLSRAAGLQLTHVSYKGGAQAIQDLLGGQVPASINPIGEILSHLPSGKLRALATTGGSRSAFLPAVQTFRESGFPSVVAESWIGVFAPRSTDRARVVALDSALSKVLQINAIVSGFANFGISVSYGSGEHLSLVLRSDLQRWSGVVKDSGFSLDD
nr:tripartite tricarboxylate transporter substrate-binding protein [uncultured Cupriavidus sp.]